MKYQTSIQAPLAGRIRQIEGGSLLEGAVIEIPIPRPVRFYRHGWQSWSLTAWINPNRPVRPINPRIVRPQADDPAHIESQNWGGAWVGAAEMPDGKIRLLGALGLEARVEYTGQSLRGTYETGSGEWFLGVGTEDEVFSHYAALLAERFGTGRIKKMPRIWCSWYSLYTDIREDQIYKILETVGDLPFDVFQLDDGWQKGIGDWDANEKFPAGMAALAEKIKATGRVAGLWLAPLIVLPSTALYRDHPDWLLRDDRGTLVPAGHNWGQPMFALDTTLPGVQEWLAALMKKVRGWGYDYLKLDFLYAGALPGKRHNGMPREAALRMGLQVLREAMGDAFFLTCGVPILPALGLCDALRVGPDVAAYWYRFEETALMNNFGTPGTQNAIRTSLNRLWLTPIVAPDPDVAYFRSRANLMTPDQSRLLQDLAHIAGFKATSDLPEWLTVEERSALDNFLKQNAPVKKTGRYTFEADGRTVDFSSAVAMPAPLPQWLTELGAWAASSQFVLNARERILLAANRFLTKEK
jgi:alpha-galactosidase